MSHYVSHLVCYVSHLLDAPVVGRGSDGSLTDDSSVPYAAPGKIALDTSSNVAVNSGHVEGCRSGLARFGDMSWVEL